MKLRKLTLIGIIIGWILLTLFNYYYMNFFFLAFEILGLILILFIFSVVQLVRLIKERRNITRLRVQKLIVFVSLLILTLCHSSVNKIIEKIDWKIFYNSRVEIVEMVKKGQIQSDTDKDFWLYELPYRFPVVSNGGNEIFIRKNDSIETMTVEFWVFRNFFESPSTKFIYTNDSAFIDKINKKIERNPKENWEIKANWYRTYGDIY